MIVGYLCSIGWGGVFMVSHRAAADKAGVAGQELDLARKFRRN